MTPSGPESPVRMGGPGPPEVSGAGSQLVLTDGAAGVSSWLRPGESIATARRPPPPRWASRFAPVARHAPTDDVGSSGSGRSVHRLATLGSVRAGSDRRGWAGGGGCNNLGWGEITTLFAIALIVFGPERLPKVAADAGRMIRELRKMAIGLTDELKAELGPELGDLDLASLHPKRLMEKALLDEDGNESAATAGPGSGAVARSGPDPPMVR